MDEQATPRPWSVPEDDRAAIYIPSTAPKSNRIRWDNGIYSDRPEADAALIVEAVNAYDRLRRIEAAARDLRVQRFGRDSSEDAMEPAWDVLRAALDSTP